MVSGSVLSFNFPAAGFRQALYEFKKLRHLVLRHPLVAVTPQGINHVIARLAAIEYYFRSRELAVLRMRDAEHQ